MKIGLRFTVYRLLFTEKTLAIGCWFLFIIKNLRIGEFFLRLSARDLADLLSALEEKCSQAYNTVRYWYSLQNFILKASSQSKIMKTIPLTVAKPLPMNIFLSAHISVISVISV